MPKKDLIIFDLDGTLIDSVPDLTDSIDYTMRRLGRRGYCEDIVRGWVGNGAAMLVKRALAGCREFDVEPQESLLREAMEIFLRHYGENLPGRTRLYPQVRETLELLEKRGYRMAIVSNKPEPFIAPILKGLSIDERFEMILGAESLPLKKPDPLPLLHCCKELAVDIERAVMVGDSSNDILAAKSAGMDSIAVSYGYNYDIDIESFSPTFSVESFAQIAAILEAEE
jgi:phosphoglycolate phosphatase